MWFALLGVLAGLLVLWVALIAVLWLAKPDQTSIREALRLLPDLLVLLKRLASDRTMPTGVRVRLWLLLAYLALPIDLVPDFIPVIGYADDAVIVALTLRSVARTAGLDGLRRHWPGSDGAFDALVRVAGLRA